MNELGQNTQMDKLAIIEEKGLTIEQKQLVSELPVMVQKFVLAKDSEIIAELSPVDRETYIFDFITELQLNVGHTKKAEDGISTELIASATSNFIFETHKTLTKEELKLACLRHFIEKDLDQEGVNLKSIAKAIRSYLNDPLKIKAMAEFNKHLDLVKRHELSPEQQDEIIRQGLIQFWRDYKKDKLFEDTEVTRAMCPVDKVRAVFYEYLEKRGFIKFDNDRKFQIAEQALTEYTNELTSKVANRGIKFTQLDMNLCIAQIKLKKNLTYKQICQRIGLFDYLNELLINDKDLELLLTQQ